MKNLEHFLVERLSKGQKDFIHDQFTEWLEEAIDEENIKSFDELEEYMTDNIIDFCDNCEISSDEMDELIDREGKYKNNNFYAWLHADFDNYKF